MNLNENATPRGLVEVIITKKDGEIIKEVGHNTIVNTGKSLIAQRLISNDINRPFYMALGSGDTAAEVTDTALETEIITPGLERKQVTPVAATTTIENDSIKYDVTFYPETDANINEIGIFDSANNGVMMCRRVINTRPVASGDTIEVIYTVTIA